MNRIYGELVKNLLLLWRDRAGLLILFLMPALLVVIITLVQNNVYKLMGESAARVLLIDEDGGELGRAVDAGDPQVRSLQPVEKPVAQSGALQVRPSGSLPTAFAVHALYESDVAVRLD